MSLSRKRKHTDAAQETEDVKSVKTLTARVAKDGEYILNHILPQKILELHKLVESSVYFRAEKNKAVAESANSDIPEPKPCPPSSQTVQIDGHDGLALKRIPKDLDETVPCNKELLQIMELLKKEIMAAFKSIGEIKLWIQLMIPRIEDGNNFGVGVQEECVSELGRMEDQGFTVLEGMTKYFTTRAKLVAKFLKHRSVTDYRQSILECDEMQYMNLRMGMIDLRDNYTIIYDLLQKNLERIKKPKGSGDATLTMY